MADDTTGASYENVESNVNATESATRKTVLYGGIIVGIIIVIAVVVVLVVVFVVLDDEDGFVGKGHCDPCYGYDIEKWGEVNNYSICNNYTIDNSIDFTTVSGSELCANSCKDYVEEHRYSEGYAYYIIEDNTCYCDLACIKTYRVDYCKNETCVRFNKTADYYDILEWQVGRPYRISLNETIKSDVKYIECNEYQYYFDYFNDLNYSLPSTTDMASIIAQYTEQTTDEYASIASFSKFSLQLMNLGAPLFFIKLSSKAALDEIKHAKFALDMTNYLRKQQSDDDDDDRCVSLDAFPSHTVDINGDIDSVLIDTIFGGCFGETMSAMKTVEESLEMSDEYAFWKRDLMKIAVDEMRHSALAWITVKWLIDTNNEKENFIFDQKQFWIENVEKMDDYQNYGNVIKQILDLFWEYNALEIGYNPLYQDIISILQSNTLAINKQ